MTDNELEITRTEAVMSHFEVLFWHIPRGTETVSGQQTVIAEI
jgi:hypothetical protein